jgi:two-component system nitrogen regulation response regulator GlnG
MGSEKLTREARAALPLSSSLAIEIVHYGGGPSPRLVENGKRIPLDHSRLDVGSSRRCQLELSDPFVSKVHCSIAKENGLVYVTDRDSRNGTWVNQVRIQRCQLVSGARLDVGRSRLRVVDTSLDESSPIVGRDKRLLEAIETIRRLARSQLPILIMGESGSGKELAARAAHEASAAFSGPFEAINCAAIPRELAESELFGHVRGAFTGAVSDFCGAFQRAAGGTLFLDEIGEMPIELQPKLLRVLEDGVIRPVGSQQGTPVSVRLVAATHRDLLREVERGRFRQDLYYRLAVGVVDLPPLRDRPGDIPLLVERFLREESASGPFFSVTESAMQWLCSQRWIGNVRALRHAVQRACALSETRVLDRNAFAPDQGAASEQDDGSVRIAGRRFADIRDEVFRKVMAQHQGNRSRAAAALGIPKSTFFDQLKRCKLDDR